MGPGKMMSSGFWIIPMAICMIFMLIMMFNRMKGGIPGGFMNSNNQSGASRNTESLLEIMNRRYAKGEISKSEYEQMKSDLAK